MADITKADLRNRVLQHLGVLAAGETASGHDANHVDAIIEAFIDGELAKAGELEGTFNSDAIPAWAQNPLRDVICFKVAPDFGVSGQILADLATSAQTGIILLYRHFADVTPSDTQVEVAENALRMLGVLVPGEISSAPELALASNEVNDFHDWLEEVGSLPADVLTLTDLADWAKPLFRDIVAYRLVAHFDIDANRVQILAGKHDIALTELISRLNEVSHLDTKVEVRYHVLSRLGIVTAGQEPTAAQADIVDDSIDKFQDWLDEIGTLPASIATITSLADWAKPFYQDVITYRVAPQFGVVDARLQEFQQRHNNALTELVSRLTAVTYANTQIEVRHHVLSLLGVITAGQEPTEAQADIVDDALTKFHDWLDEVGTLPGAIVTLTSLAEWAKPFYRDVVAYRVAPQFGVVDARLQDLLARHNTSLGELISRLAPPVPETTAIEVRNDALYALGVVPPGTDPKPIQADVVDDIVVQLFDMLDERGTIGFTAGAIPPWAMPLIRDIVAADAAPQFGVVDVNRLGILEAKKRAAEAELGSRFSALGETTPKTILRNRILQHLGIVGVAETPTAAQIELVEEVIDQGFDHLVTDGAILPTVTLSALPDYVMLPLRDHFAYMCAGSFGIKSGKRSNLFMEHRNALKVLYGQVQDREAPNTDSIEATYY